MKTGTRWDSYNCGYALYSTVLFRRNRRNKIPSHRCSRSRLPTGCKTYRTYTCHRNWSPHNRNRKICRLRHNPDCPNKRCRYRRSWSRHIRSHRKPPSHCNPGWIYRTYTLNNCCKKHSHRCRTCRKRHSRDWTCRRYTGHRSYIRHSHRYSSWKKPYIRGEWYSRCSYRRRKFPILHILRSSWKNCI